MEHQPGTPPPHARAERRRGPELFLPPHVERTERQSLDRAELASGLTRALEPLDQLSPLRGGAPRAMSRTACPCHDSARLRVGGEWRVNQTAHPIRTTAPFGRLRMEECLGEAFRIPCGSSSFGPFNRLPGSGSPHRGIVEGRERPHAGAHPETWGTGRHA